MRRHALELVARQLAFGLDDLAIHHEPCAICVKRIFEAFERHIGGDLGIRLRNLGGRGERRGGIVGHAKSAELRGVRELDRRRCKRGVHYTGVRVGRGANPLDGTIQGNCPHWHVMVIREGKVLVDGVGNSICAQNDATAGWQVLHRGDDVNREGSSCFRGLCAFCEHGLYFIRLLLDCLQRLAEFLLNFWDGANRAGAACGARGLREQILGLGVSYDGHHQYNEQYNDEI
ncbi:hypothetical protein ATCV1_z074L [Acanthocystis turfacea chlorella virus 1]|uniref:Uncharacterized protein z074L n=1 Tax=Chlorovirus heliozoae TaxID=322019 RepID=A7K834_9PHYC|nr:hypothetical protein ATCV1_z074L [Acanthocystis turfacea chlorella virus 1]ABT16208.1 hypothetical protein ATCV1_z074L [Acanthocystis turfacea chlorella virus 1]